jgi:hypothetical protein
MTKMLNLKVNVDETNLVLKALSTMPYNEVANLIYSIKSQGDQQMNPVAEETKPENAVKPEQLNG